MSYERSGVYLLKRWSPDKWVDHYAVGLAGVAACRSGFPLAVAIQLLPNGLQAEKWIIESGWEVLVQTHDETSALTRLQSESSTGYALLGANCEHFARYVVTGTRESRQVQGVAAVAAVAGLVLLAGR